MRSTVPAGSYGAPSNTASWFGAFASKTALFCGKPTTFLAAAAIVAGWGLSGPIFNYSDTWQLVINTGTTIITFLMVFLIQHTQNRDTLALQLKLDELILATRTASNEIAAIEEKSEDKLEAARESVRRRASAGD